MIEYFKKLFSRQYFHKYEAANIPRNISYHYWFKCKKCGKYKDQLPLAYLGLVSISLCKLSDTEYIIKSIIE